MKNPLLIPELRELMAVNDTAAIREFCQQSHPESVAELIEALDTEEIWRILQMLDLPQRASIFSHFDLDQQVELATGHNRVQMAHLLEEMPADDRADLVQNLDKKVRDELLPLVARAEREDIKRLARYEEETAGAAMSTDYAVLRPDVTIEEAIHQLRAQAPDKETIYYIYVVDEYRKLIGFVSLKDIIVARPGRLIRDLMHTDVIKANVHDDQESVANQVEKYDLIAIPVVDDDNVIVGIVTHDDAIDIIRQEQTEDIEKLMAISGEHESTPYLKISAWRHFRNRATWIFILGLVSLIGGLIIQLHEEMLVQIAVLATLIPMLAATGGNTGSQSAALVIRALAVKEIFGRDILRVLFKEFCVALPLAFVMSILAFGRLFLFASGETMPPGVSLWMLAFAAGVALALQVLSSTLIGALLPLGAVALKLDPAVVASPSLATIVDITGLLIYFTVVSVMVMPA
ncbi:MAG: magnesium transporter [Phycisphaerae bacterium]|nr:magnesium transporter [Phycisphaerae bacterium]